MARMHFALPAVEANIRAMVQAVREGSIAAASSETNTASKSKRGESFSLLLRLNTEVSVWHNQREARIDSRALYRAQRRRLTNLITNHVVYNLHMHVCDSAALGVCIVWQFAKEYLRYTNHLIEHESTDQISSLIRSSILSPGLKAGRPDHQPRR